MEVPSRTAEQTLWIRYKGSPFALSRSAASIPEKKQKTALATAKDRSPTAGARGVGTFGPAHGGVGRPAPERGACATQLIGALVPGLITRPDREGPRGRPECRGAGWCGGNGRGGRDGRNRGSGRAAGHRALTQPAGQRQAGQDQFGQRDQVPSPHRRSGPAPIARPARPSWRRRPRD